ncbi:MAG: SCO family protein [Bdellovibrionota bacterium]
MFKPLLLLCSFCCFISTATTFAATSEVNKNIDAPDKIYQKLGQKIDLNLSFTNQDGQKKTIGELLKNNSALILTLNYYRCTTMCTFQFLNLAEVLKELRTPLGKGYEVASISFDPTDTAVKAKQIHDTWVPKTGNPNGAWNFFVGPPQNIEPLAKQLNFYYEKDDEGNYSHAAALFFIQPDGTLYRYLYGIVYNKTDVAHALRDTSSGAVGTLVDKFYALFSTYEPIRGKYLSYFDN